MKKIFIAAGGTGGHIYPALAFADEIRKKYPDCEIRFFGSEDRMEGDVIPKAGYPFTGLSLANTHGNVLHKLNYGISLMKESGRMKSILKEEKPDACVGFGNYISVPLIYEAHKLGIPTMISEQNSFAGKANVFLGKYADAVELSYERSMKDFDTKKCRVLGNPAAGPAFACKADPDLVTSYGLDPHKPLLFVMMGSLGSSTVSKAVEEACRGMDPSIQVLIAAGRCNEYVFTIDQPNVKVVPFVPGRTMLKTADLSICRAGATTLCEITAVGAASILIPSPFVPNNHQVYNAEELVEKGAAIMIEEKDLTPDGLAGTVSSLMNDKEKRLAMKQAARSLGKKDCGERMVEWLEEITA